MVIWSDTLFAPLTIQSTELHLTPMEAFGIPMMTLLTTLTFTAAFGFVALASSRIGQALGRWGLPNITGYLLAGLLAGPFVLGLLPREANDALRFVDDMALAVIAFVAGSELYLKEMRHRLKSITFITASVIVVSFPLIVASIFLLTRWIPFTSALPAPTRLAVGMLGGVILLAASPPSTIAVIKETRAKGHYTSTILGVTVTMDVIIIVMFAIAVALGGPLVMGETINALFVVALILDLGVAVGGGYVVSKLLQMILGAPWQRPIKAGLVLLVGYGIFLFADRLADISHAALPFEIHAEPLLLAMTAGFLVTNFSPYRNELGRVLHDVEPVVYIAFFTLTGLTLNLDILFGTLTFALLLFVVRLIGLALGSWLGGRFAQASDRVQRFTWLGLSAQAGIALGLAREVAVVFPSLGDAFATLIIAVIVLNQVLGPLFFKWALRRLGETHLPEVSEPDLVRDVLILGIEPQSLTLARQLELQGWRVAMADTDVSHVPRLPEANISCYHVPTIASAGLERLLTARTDALVAMLPDDADNLRALELAYEKGVPRLVVRPQTMALAESFSQLGALIVDPTSAMVNLLTQSVRAPQSAAMLLHLAANREIVQVTISNPDIDGLLLRDLRLPTDVLCVDVTRDGNLILPNGYTRLRLHDEVTLMGAEDSLEEAVLRLGY